MYIFTQLYENVFTISLKFHEKNILEASTSAAKEIFMFYIKKYIIFSNYIYVIIIPEYTHKCTKLHYF